MDEENINYSTNDAGLDNQPVGMESMNTEPELNNDEQEIKFDNSKDKKASKVVLLSVITGMFVVILAVMFAILPNLDFTNKDTSKHSETTGGNDEPIEEKKEINLGELGIQGNGLEELDLAFLKLENNNEKNIVYSPLSIKYALAMLNEGTGGNSKEQIEKVLGNYVPKKYINSENLSLANAMFVNEKYQDKIREEYSLNLQTKYGAELFFDPLMNPNNINNWVKDKTFGLVNNIVNETDPIQNVFYLVNALAIDMEWKQTLGVNVSGPITAETIHPYNVHFEYIKSTYNNTLYIDSYSKGAQIAATANRYDIIKELGEDKIRETVQNSYDEWSQEEQDYCTAEEIVKNAPNLDEYVETLSKHYGHLSGSTDFEFYDSDDVIAFAKDLKEYDGTTFQYIGVMPKNKSISEYIDETSAADINKIIKSLKPIEMGSFKDGAITILSGYVPFFAFDYDLHLVDDLKSIGVSDIFSDEAANLSKISDMEGLYIANAAHKARIDFSNEGIKAGAATVVDGGLGSAVSCRFVHEFEAPIERIELKFNNPYIFLVRDKNTGEAWFAGVVHDPQQKAE